jgi:hypothetical protein
MGGTERSLQMSKASPEQAKAGMDLFRAPGGSIEAFEFLSMPGMPQK